MSQLLPIHWDNLFGILHQLRCDVTNEKNLRCGANKERIHGGFRAGS